MKSRLFPLAGAIELHGEALDAEYLRLAHKVKLRNVVLKWPGGTDTASVARLANELLGGEPIFFGGIVLDRPAGGFNVAAVESSHRRGGRFVWMPTVDARHHRQQNREDETGSLTVLDEGGYLRKDVEEIIDAVVRFDLVLGTGHIDAREAECLVEAAVRRGVRRVIVNHPLLLGYEPADLERLAKYSGVFIEHCYKPDHVKPFDVRRIVDAIDRIGPEQSLIADFGVFETEPNIADALVERGVPEAMIRQLVIDTPAKVLETRG